MRSPARAIAILGVLTILPAQAGEVALRPCAFCLGELHPVERERLEFRARQRDLLRQPDHVEQARREWQRRWEDIRRQPDHVDREREAYERRQLDLNRSSRP